jgi:hypothetical protein
MSLFTRRTREDAPSEVSADSCKSGFSTVRLYDEDMRLVRTIERLRDVNFNCTTLTAKNELGLLACYQAPYLCIEEQP